MINSVYVRKWRRSVNTVWRALSIIWRVAEESSSICLGEWFER